MLDAAMRSYRYRLVVEGELGPRYASAFDGMALAAHDGVTEITGPIIDASHLQGVLERIASLGLTLRSVNPIETEDRHGGRAPTHHQPGRSCEPGPQEHGRVPAGRESAPAESERERRDG
jgi:hypothetical protein